MIRLDGLVETVLNNFDSLVMPICLPKPYYGVEEPKIREFVVAGWGKIDDNQGEAEILRKGVANEVLKKLSVPIYEKSRCYNVFEGVDETHICAGYVFKRQFILRLFWSQFPSAIGWRKKSLSYNNKTTIWVSHCINTS